ncbi:MAG: hypothetical protein U0271_07650 [Polyangiaceae bacterium]
MRYLYADSSPFPLMQNFLATLCAATDTCVALLRAETAVEEEARAIREAEQRAASDLAELAHVEARVEAAVGSRKAPVEHGVAGATLARARELAFATVDEARAKVARTREEQIAAAHAKLPRSTVSPALSQLVSTHELPDTAWGVEWRALPKEKSARAELHARTAIGLEATLGVAIPADHAFARAARLDLLGVPTTVELTHKPLFRKERLVATDLSRWFVTEVVLSQERASLRLSQGAAKGAPGLAFQFADKEVTVTRVDGEGYPRSEAEHLSEVDAAAMRRVWNRVTSSLGTLVAHRTAATSVKLGGIAAAEIAHPASIARVLVHALAPYVREIAKRSRTPRELALKRELGDGCREELFISYETVCERFAPLPEAQQAIFEEFELREETTQVTPLSSRPPAPPAFGPPPAFTAPTAPVYNLPVVRPPRVRLGRGEFDQRRAVNEG